MNQELYATLLRNAENETLADYIITTLFNKPSKHGSRTMIGTIPDCIFIDSEPLGDIGLAIYDSKGSLLLTVEDFGLVNNMTDEEYTVSQDKLNDLCWSVGQIIDTENVISLR